MDVPRLLLVEDDPDVRLLVEHVLLDAAYDVDSCETLGDGRRLLAGRDYDLVVADGRLADGVGTTLADTARESGIPAMIITGYAFVLNVPGVNLCDYEVLLKPISPEELLTTVAKLLAVSS